MIETILAVLVLQLVLAVAIALLISLPWWLATLLVSLGWLGLGRLWATLNASTSMPSARD